MSLPDSRAGWPGVHAVVAGFGAAGFACADNLLHLGADVVALDEEAEGRADEAELLEVLGATVRLGPGATDELPADADLLVVSPGWPDDAPLRARALARGVPVWSDAELAWRLRDPDLDAPWLVVAGAAGPTDCVAMLDAILRAAGLRCVVAGPAGRPAVEAVMDPEPHDVLVVELDPTQLRDVHSTSPHAAVVLDVADADPAALGRAYERVRVACVYDLAEPAAEELVREAEVVEGARAIGITLGLPPVGTLGLVEDILADRAFVEERTSSAAELCTLADLTPPGVEPDPGTVRAALAAAALARAHGVEQAAVRDGLRAWAAR